MRWKFLAPFVVLSSFCLGQVPGYVPQDGLVAWYPFNANFYEHFSNEQGIEVNVTFIPDRSGVESSALQFNNNGSVHYNSGPWMDWGDENSWSISCWFHADEPHHGSVFEKWFALADNAYPFNLRVVPNEEVAAGMYPGVPYAGTGVIGYFQMNTWTHAVSTYDAESRVLSLYVNGVLASTEILPEGDYVNADPLFIGRRQNESTRYFRGGVDDLAFFERVLSLSEVQNLAADVLLTPGCTDETSCNFNSEATIDDGSCEYGCLNCGLGTVWDEQLEQCVVIESCQEDLDYDGVIGVNDLMSLLASFGTDCSTYEEEIGCGTPIEYHGYEYQTVLIGDQCWFAENLRTELYLNGEEIPSSLDRETWCNATYGATTYYAETADSCISDPSVNFPGVPCENPEGALEFYGRLYNWHAVNDVRELCPSGWHVPSSTEWLSLEEYVEASYPYHSGLVLREHGSWRNPVTGLDLFGFKLRPGGYRNDWNGDGSHYRSAGRVGTWFWTADNGSDEGTAYSFYQRAYNEINSLVSHHLYGPSQNQHQFGFSIRCIKD